MNDSHLLQPSIPLIQMEDIEMVFLTDKVETHVLSGVNLEIHHGDYMSISGPSGCGKSTLGRPTIHSAGG